VNSNGIDPFFDEKKPWSKVKDEILGKYIDCYLKTLPVLKRPILIVDAFAGPGKFRDGDDGSPLIVLKAITNRNPQVGTSCLFADIKPEHRTELERNIATYITQGVAETPLADCEAALTRALEVGKNHTLFFYLDPYGIKDLDFEMICRVFKRNPSQSTEVLINFNFRAFMRMSGNWDYGDTADEVARKVKASKIETVNRVMGGSYWQPIVTDPKLDKFEREDAVVRAYMARLRDFLKFTVSVPVKDQLGQPGIPVDDLAKYHLIFGTRNAKAVVYMNDVAYPLLEPYLNQFREGLLFDLRPERYAASEPTAIKDEIVQVVGKRKMLRAAIYEAIVPAHFMQYKTTHYRRWIDELVFDERRLFPDPKSVKRKDKVNDKTLLATTPWSGGEGA
jgi:three-Cys-motif partner protein